MQIILIQAEDSARDMLQLALRARAINTYATDIQEDGVEMTRHYDHDLILLDLDSCDARGAETLRNLRANRSCAPILAMSSDNSIAAKVRILELGADGYVTKPFDKEELVARLHALVRRARGHSQSEIVTGGLSVDLMSKSVSMNGKPVRVTNMEYRILELLSLRRGSTLTKQMFIEHLYGDNDGPESRTVELFVCKLRKKLALAGDGNRFIETIGRHGYVLAAPVAN